MDDAVVLWPNTPTSGVFALATWNPTINTSALFSFTGLSLAGNMTIDQATNFGALNVTTTFSRSTSSLFTLFQLFAVNLTDTITADVLPWSLVALSDNSIQNYTSAITNGAAQVFCQNVKSIRCAIS